MKAELKTKETDASVEDFLNRIEDEQTRADCKKIAGWMQKATGDKPKMWGESIVGFGKVHLKYESGRELDFLKIGFSPRKQNITLYIDIREKENEKLLSELGKHKTSKWCLYIKKLNDVDENVLTEMIDRSVKS